MQKRWLTLCLALLICLLLLCACGRQLAGTEWAAAGYVDELGNEQASVNANGAFASLTIAFFEGRTGTLRMDTASYTFSYKEDDDILSITMQDGQQAQIRLDGDKIFFTFEDATLYFLKK